MADKKPILLVIAGPNGSGKSSFTSQGLAGDLPVIDPDAIAKKLSPSSPESVSVEAGRKAIKQQHDNILNKTSFAVETTMSGRSALRLMDEAKDAGFEVTLAYVRIDDVTANLKRIEGRVADGGHNVPSEDVLRRFNRSLDNLPSAIEKSDKAILFDNSALKPEVVAELSKNEYKFAKEAPDWATRAAYKAALITHGKAENPEERQQAMERVVDASEAKGVDVKLLEDIQKKLSKKHDRDDDREL